MSASLDLRCYLVTGAPHEKVVDVAAAAAAGGAGVVQVRSKPISVRDLTALAVEVAAAVQKANPATRVLIDDRVDVAAALMPEHNIHGVHIGQDDLDPRLARQLLGKDAIIGLTTGTLPLVQQANEYADVIDYIGAGPFRPTPTKDSGREPLGLEGYPALVEASRVPVVAIGDVHAEDAADLAATGVAGLAIVRGIMQAENPKAYAESVVSQFSEANER
ncbi:thiamine phosphate synthase [Corynebacterium jeikeium]|uniref:Thiamine-phosphate synthase n=1 Tax=Corynebacterium jeikeium (strain K411) TaxID=306537 RepID=THIE_CORJK|nr:thiamine phosphate synthase [Corynebacterium jeikeium]Q4JVZ1.1 RecName: Full=Thiamine-phosphate synthase; Short=TP synthase; Short=TPS; AltName: Full=Thiamine-phosphate pyrophosphorylase; Short=TMP pyrophosphorylase; Short=TMP-PPase [Corynebacterium jeikeium K411]EEW17151.1 putative thiamine-phosphate diphosphorylase [Corynebacterium jeikeium ATCC 43734]OOD29600.1 thiamine phosphate synthase [Corynebacterium jeikeium]WCZ53422.1 Thiamine-phosphate synthase [Corynebacterium jeikeium]CAI37016.